MSILDEKVSNIKKRIEYLKQIIECGEAEKAPDTWLVERYKELNEAMDQLKGSKTHGNM
jgi:hypothetical protein